MSALLNASSSERVARRFAPLVWRSPAGLVHWVENGIGFSLLAASRRWVPMVDVECHQGTVLSGHEVVLLVIEFGRPTP